MERGSEVTRTPLDAKCLIDESGISFPATRSASGRVRNSVVPESPIMERASGLRPVGVGAKHVRTVFVD